MSLAFNKFNSFVADVANGVFNLGADPLKLLLTDTQPSSANSKRSDIVEIAGGNGYPTGGLTVPITQSSQTNGLYILIGSPVTLAAIATIPQFRYLVLYDPNSANSKLIGWWDNGVEINIQGGTSYQVSFDQTNGILQIT